MTSPAEPIATTLSALFDAERTTRRLHGELARSGPDALVAALKSEAEKALALTDQEELALRLVRISALLGDLHGATAVDVLIDILACDEPEARQAAGEALENLAYDRFKEVALGIERALGRLPKGSPALSELPYLLAEIPEPGAVKLLGKFLGHADPEAVAAAIEALVEVGDPSAAPLLAPLEKDKRHVQIEEEEGEEGRVTLGELASEARQLLSEIHEAQNEGRGRKG
jgi:HEAT repeat protein